MKKLASFVRYLYGHHFIRYLFVGGSTFLIDFGLLVGLHGKSGVSVALATSVAYWTSIIYNFTLNRWWTFSLAEKKNLHKHLFAYGLLLCFNYVITVTFVYFASQHISYAIAKVAIVIIQVSWTYYIYKNYIFTNKDVQHLSNSKTRDAHI